MAQAQTSGQSGSSTKPFDLQSFPVQFAEMGRKQMETMVEVQKNFLEAAQEMNRTWLARAQSEATLVSEFITKLSSARSFPEAASACQECMGQQMQMLTEDSRRMLSDGEKLMKSSARLFSNGGTAPSS